MIEKHSWEGKDQTSVQGGLRTQAAAFKTPLLLDQSHFSDFYPNEIIGQMHWVCRQVFSL